MIKQQVYFSNLKLNGRNFALSAQAGWHEGENLRFIHAMRYKPEFESETEFSFQPQIFAETSNEVLVNLARGKFEAETIFEADGEAIKSGCWIESKSDNLQVVGVNESERITIAKYIDCDCFFYTANRNPSLSVKYSKPSEGDISDSTRAEGFPQSQCTNIFEPSDVYFQFDYARLYGDLKATEILNRVDDVFKHFGANIKFVCDVFKKESRQILINNSISVQYKTKETLSLVLDLLIRLSGIKKCDLNSSAIVLIENPSALLPEVLTELFPKIQFIVN